MSDLLDAVLHAHRGLDYRRTFTRVGAASFTLPQTNPPSYLQRAGLNAEQSIDTEP
jgi:hypothetical protein